MKNLRKLIKGVTMDRIHIIGAGGIAMSAIAKSFLEQGFKVTGSDLQKNNLVLELQEKGAEVSIGHQPENIVPEIDKVVYSDAIPNDNVELEQARKYGIELLDRSAALALLTNNKQVISAAGTHGKTTTSSLVTHLLEEGELQPSFIIGGIVKNFASNYFINEGEYFVLEGDEYGKSFLKYPSDIGIVTNIEFDHPDIYNDLQEMKEAYYQYITDLNELLVANQSVLNQLGLEREDLGIEVITVGVNDAEAEYNATNIYSEELTSYFTLEHKGEKIDKFQLSALGDYNVKHALEAIAVGCYCGISMVELKAALKTWQGVKRRFEVIARTENQIVITDYAHHPQEVEAVVANLEQIETDKRKVVIFQPHQYLRTKSLFADYKDVLDFNIDKFIIYQIYKVRERVNDRELKALGEELSHIISPEPVAYFNDWNKLEQWLTDYKPDEGAIYLFLGAGDIDKFARKWVI